MLSFYRPKTHVAPSLSIDFLERIAVIGIHVITGTTGQRGFCSEASGVNRFKRRQTALTRSSCSKQRILKVGKEQVFWRLFDELSSPRRHPIRFGDIGQIEA
jgi:hypothetical protein